MSDHNSRFEHQNLLAKLYVRAGRRPDHGISRWDESKWRQPDTGPAYSAVTPALVGLTSACTLQALQPSDALKPSQTHARP